MSQLRDVYLIFYNLFQALGWAVSLFRVLSNFVSTTSVHGAYSSAGELICLLQTLAFLEVIHGAIGIVPSGALLPLMQWGGRTHFLLAIVRRIHEIIRYSHYAVNCMGSSPNWMTFIRYNAFIVLYPIGVFPGKMWLMHQALPFIEAENFYADILPFSYDKFVKALLFCYPLLWMKLYLHMFKQRRSKLGKQQKKKSN
ncbi:UNVERIFIED_CONTAM: Very-long-chain (3R)-3-hydroxyacyl-CoA dehydratase 2 [Sesamum angustifolium]|uniref:Very-long-chain (3R)-3-hydroxyacyl-CoA dehydratase n=1 Tax=Sesamum angustifolium TaxID=2727405 RepID=A0AAW2QP97_9LAMI